ITALARASRITKQSMSEMVSELENAGYVERTADPADSRAVRVRLTPRGRAYGEAAREFSRSVEAEWGRKIGTRRMEQLRATLELLRSEVFHAGE
ncbi:MAG TPA: MarR family transcriptional regulator, partial [Steroidobacteraceae bacterium]|nr:MarR family transcriptional regulator [Steroidobacteraceae bacterium]